MCNKEFINKCIKIIVETNGYNEEDINCVWLCKTLQNNKALFSTNISDGKYFELTFNGTKQELYFDEYIKNNNICIKEF